MRLIKFAANIADIGAATLQRFSGAKKPLYPDGDDELPSKGFPVEGPGYVSARMIGQADCREK